MSAPEPGGAPVVTGPGLMKAIVQDTFGGPEVLVLREVPVPVPGDDEVLVRVRAASVNAADWHLMRGKPYAMRLAGFGLRTPKARARGLDVAGVVEAVGASVTTLRPGDEVYGQGDMHAGTFAELAVVRAAHLALKPRSASFEEAAAVPLAGMTALQGIRDSGGVTAGQRVLVHGASGGVGSFAVQIAKALGAEVTGVCSTRNVEMVKRLGADHVVDYTREDFTRTGQRYDVIVDLVTDKSLTALRRALTPRGTLVLSGGGGGKVLGPLPLILRALAVSLVVRQRLRPLTQVPRWEDLVHLATLVDAGDVKPAIDTVYPLAETAAAVRHLEEGHPSGKVAVSV